MSNGTKNATSEAKREQLARLVDAYHGLLCADERRLHEAMLEFEQSCWPQALHRAA